MTQLHPKAPRKQTTEPILGTALLEKKTSYNRLNGNLGIIDLVRVRWLNRGKDSSHIRIINMDHMRISGTEISSVILSQTKQFINW